MTEDSPALNRLLAAVATGDENAMGSLYDVLAPHIFGLARSHFDTNSAVEVTQQVFLDLWHRARQFDPAVHQVAEWATGIATEWIGRHEASLAIAARA